MNRITRKKNALRVAALALCTLTVGTVQGLAQDTAPTQTQDAPQGPPPGGGGPGGRGHMEDRRIEMMTRELSLTPDQVTQVKAIEMDSRKQSMALRDDTSTPREQKRDKMMAIRTASETKVRALLNDDQKTKYDAMQARMRERMRNRGGDGGDGPPPPPPSQQ